MTASGQRCVCIEHIVGMPMVHSAQHGRLHERGRPTHDSVPWRRASAPWVVAATPDSGLLRAGSLGKHRGGPPARLYGRGGCWGLTPKRWALGAPPHGPEARRWTLRTATKPDSCTGTKPDSQLTGLRTDLCARANFIEDKADKQFTAMRADVAGQVAITATELTGELDSSTRSCCRRFTEGKPVQPFPVIRAQGILGTKVLLHT